jgi:hypothetical protein
VFTTWDAPSSAVLGDNPQLMAREYLFAEFNAEVRPVMDGVLQSWLDHGFTVYWRALV